MRVGRNDACPCGSGNKYKNCCQGTESRQSKPVTMLFVAIALIAGVGLIAAVRNKDERRGAPMAAAAPAGNPGAAQPGPAPAGKVWSVEHGHWHDAAAAGGAAAPGAVQATGNLTPSSDNSSIKIEPLAAGAEIPPTTAPITITPHAPPTAPGPAPAGKVWSPEHNHWHDAVAPGTPGATPVAAPAPQVTMTPQPAGAVPPGKVWSPEHGHWHDAPKP